MAGRHRARTKKKSGALRWSFFLFMALMIAVGALGYLYGKAIESKIHGKGSRGKEIVLPGPAPQKPITFLILGSDTRGSDRGRSDTLMVLRVNPEKKVATLLSIPRDMRVRIPRLGMDKINAAYAEGGPELAIETVGDFTGFEINHYVEVDFQGFKRLVDALGGIDIDVQPPNGKKYLYDPEINLRLPRGLQHLDGEEALKFVRVRHVDDDFGRTKRQQQFLKAVFEKIIKPASLAKLPQLAEIVADNVRTDSGLGLREMLSYGQLLRSIPRENVRMATLPGTPETIGGISYVVPDDEKISELLDRVQNDEPLEPGAIKREIANADIVVDVQNGSGIGGQGHAVADKLRLKGFTVGVVSNADSFAYSRTRILASPESYDKAKKVYDALGLGEIFPDRLGGSSVIVIVGRDFASRNSRG